MEGEATWMMESRAPATAVASRVLSRPSTAAAAAQYTS